MKTLSPFLIIALLLCFPCAAAAGTVTAKHSLTLDDAAGDVQDHDGHPGKDVVRLVIDSDGQNLKITTTLKKNVEQYLKGHLAGDVVLLYFDTDTKKETGGKTFWGNKTGFEYLVGVRTCISYKEGGEACAGGLKLTPEKYFTSIKTEKFEQGKTSSKSIHDIFWKSPRSDISGNTAVATIPYSEIGVSSGQTIRIAVREEDSSFDEKSFFPEIMFTLK